MKGFLSFAFSILVCFAALFLIEKFVERNDGKHIYYHAILHIDGSAQPIDAVAEMIYYADGNIFDSLHLPYGFIEDDCADWDFDSDELTFYMGDNGIRATAKLLGEAEQTDAQEVASSVVSISGSYVSSINSELYHIDSCLHAQRIKDKNLLRFDNAAQCEAYDLIACDDCLG